ncbi:MAG: type II toxin-antitoxin system PemK/MazF family toxin [Candidatus Binatia bacterium]|jgi:mRNA-degrading endonuclease toxin of MazEF toxin-antitoxin module
MSKHSVVNVSQVATIDKQALLKRVGALAAPKLALVEEGLRQVLRL